MARKRVREKVGLLEQINVNTVLAGIIVIILAYLFVGFFQTADAPTSVSGAQFTLPRATASSSGDSSVRQMIRALQVKLRNTGLLSTRSELSVLYEEAVHQSLIAPNEHDVDWLRALSLFGVEKPRLPEVVAIAVIYERLLNAGRAMEHYLEAVDLLRSATESEKTSHAAFCYDRLADLQARSGAKEDAISTVAEALETRVDDTFANRWYGWMIEMQITLKAYEAAMAACNKCISELSGDFVPHNCLHSKGMLAAWLGNIEQATNSSISNFAHIVERTWKRDRDARPCKALHFPVTYDHFSDEERAAVPGLTAREIPVPEIPELCSGQKWPFYLKRTRGIDFEVKTARHIFDEMQCLSSKEKVPVLYTLENVVVKGDGKIISSDDYCAVYSFGYPYQNTRFHPRLEGKDDYNVLRLPFVDLDEAIVLHSQLDEHYYHLAVEGMAMPLLMQYVDREAWANSKLILQAHTLSAGFMQHAHVPIASLQRYDPDLARYRVKKLHVVDWKFLDSTVYHHPSDYYVPPANVLSLMRRVHMSGNFHPGLNETVARDAVIYVHRDPAEIGSISNWYTLIDRLNATATARGLDFFVHKGEGSFRDQIELFKRAVAVVGPHGAGLANILFCEQTTAVIELRSEPKAVSEYSRMASALNLEYWNVPTAQIGRYDRSTTLSATQISYIAQTLDYVLYDRAFVSVANKSNCFCQARSGSIRLFPLDALALSQTE